MTQLSPKATLESPLAESKGVNARVQWSQADEPLRGLLTDELRQIPAPFGLGQLPLQVMPDAVTDMTCGYCSTGCSLRVHLRNGEAVSLSPNPDYPVNQGMACPKGWEALSVLNAPDRATIPLVRTARGMQPVSWEQAATTFSERIKAVQREHGAHSVAFLGTGQLPTEELAFLGCLSKFGMGMLHGDANTRQCMATAAVAYKQAFGFDAPPFSYTDLESSDLLIFVGANPCIAHPIMWQRVMQNPGPRKVVVLDPRTTETAAAADMHLSLAPKSDLILCYALARELIERGQVAQAFVDAYTQDFDAFAKHVQSFTLAVAAQRSGLPAGQLRELCDWIVKAERVSFWWTMGVNQSFEGVRLAQAIINLALLTGSIGRPGTGPNSITGQCNAMGSRLFSNTTGLVGGHDFANPAHREKVSALLGIPIDRIPTTASWTYDQILDGVDRGEIKALWIVGTNPAHSWIQQQKFAEVAKKLEFLVVQDMYHSTETAALADLVLPAAGWGEKEGTFINSERRISVIKRVCKAPGQALADFSIFRLLAQAWGCGDWFAEWTSPEAAFHKLKQVSAGQPCDITGIESYAQLDRLGGIQWPYRGGESGDITNRRLFADGQFYHANGKARFLFTDPAEPPEVPDSDFPFWLITGRGTSAQWHTQTRTSKSAMLRKLYPAECYLEMHPADVQRHQLKVGKAVQVSTRRGALLATLMATNTLTPGQIFLPMHYPEVNRLTLAHFDPYSRQPSYKDCAARVEAVN